VLWNSTFINNYNMYNKVRLISIKYIYFISNCNVSESTFNIINSLKITFKFLVAVKYSLQFNKTLELTLILLNLHHTNIISMNVLNKKRSSHFYKLLPHLSMYPLHLNLLVPMYLYRTLEIQRKNANVLIKAYQKLPKKCQRIKGRRIILSSP